jgi:hypothetical protein
VQNSAQGPLRTRARIQNGNLAMEYRATNAVADWWVLIQLDNVTLSDTP